MRKHKAQFGSIINGTLRTEDLLPAFCEELRMLRGALPKSVLRDLSAVKRGELTGEDVLDGLFDLLEEYAPPYAYFGANEGDGSAFGFWLGDIAHSFDGLKVSDTSEVPKDYRGEVLHVNDHGNMTLYVARARGRLVEIWSLV